MKLMKKVLPALLAFTIVTSLASPFIVNGGGSSMEVHGQTKQATLNMVNVSVNGDAATALPAYNIDGYNYFRLRDIAQKLNYHVSPHPQLTYGIILTPSEPYEGVQESPAATPAKVNVVLSGESTLVFDYYSNYPVVSFNLGGYNYYKLADIQAAAEYGSVPLSLVYNQDTNTIQITAQTLQQAQQVVADREAQRLVEEEEKKVQNAAKTVELRGNNGEIYPKEVLKLVNEERAKIGASPLEWSDELAKVAQAHCEDMRERSFFSHYNPDGESPQDRIDAAGISYGTAGENIAYNYGTPEDVMSGWMNSPGHRAAILNPSYKKIGVGWAGYGIGSTWAQVFTD